MSPSAPACALQLQALSFGGPGALCSGEELNVKRTFQLALALSTAGCAFAGQVSTDFRVTNPAAKVDVIVQFSGTPTAALFGLLGGNGATTKKKFSKIPKVQVITAPAGKVNAIAKLPGVKFVS